jgi:hypothetical protein
MKTPGIVIVAAWVTVIGTAATFVLHFMTLRRKV